MKYSFLLFFCWLTFEASAQIYVKAGSTGANNGSSWANAYTTLQAGLAAATNGSSVWVAAGTYHADASNPGVPNFFFGGFSDHNISVYGGFNGTETSVTQRDYNANPTVLTGDYGPGNTGNSHRIFYIAYLDDITIDGFVIENTANNASNGWGNVFGAHDCQNMTMKNCLIRNHSTAGSGGQGCFRAVNNTSMEIINCVITGNTGTVGSMAVSQTGSTIKFTNCTVVDNTLLSGSNSSISFSGGGTIEYVNSIIRNSGNTAGTATYSYCFTDLGIGGATNSSLNPMLDANYAPLSGSPVIDFGNNGINLEPYDLAFNNRNVGGVIDAGAYEYVAPAQGPLYWSTNSYGAIDADVNQCVDQNPNYFPVETSSCGDGGLVSGGDISDVDLYTCQQSYGGTDIKILRTDINENVVFHVQLGTGYDDHLIRTFEDHQGRIVAIGNTQVDENNTIFIHVLDASNGTILFSHYYEGATVYDAVQCEEASYGFLLTGEEDGHMFFAKILVNPGSSLVYVKRTTEEDNTIGHAITQDFDDNRQRVIIGGQGEYGTGLWTIEPYPSPTPSFTSYYINDANDIRAIKAEDGYIYAGGEKGRLFKFDKALTTVLFTHHPTTNVVDGKKYYPVITDIEILGNTIYSLYAPETSAQQERPIVMAVNKTTGTYIAHDLIRWENPGAEAHFETSQVNQFDLDKRGNICVNTGIWHFYTSSPPVPTTQDRNIFVHRLDNTMEESCTWGYMYDLNYANPDRTILILSDYSANSGLAITTGSVQSSDRNDSYINELMCESYPCETASAGDLGVNDQGTMPVVDVDGVCDGEFAFDGPSENMLVSTTTTFVSYCWVTNTGLVFTTPTVTFPQSVRSFSLYAVDENGCGHYQTFCIREFTIDVQQELKQGEEDFEPETKLVSIFPNPSKGQFQMTVKDAQMKRFMVHNTLGEVVSMTNFRLEDGAQGNFVIDLTGQPDGIYFVTLLGDETQQTMKIVKH